MKAQAQPCAALVHGTGDRAGCRLGGRPALGSGHRWPAVGGRPLSFVAEIDLVEVQSACKLDWLPERGWLHFFYDLVEWPGGFAPSDRNHFAVLYTPDSERPQEVAEPERLDATLLFPSVPVAPRAALSHPDPLLLEKELGILADLPDDEWELVNDFREVGALYPRHQVGGHPSPIQAADIALDCQLASNGIDVGGPEGYRRPERRLLESGAADWRLLLQLDSDEAAGMMWGDVGTLYYMVRAQDALAGDFSRSWLQMQCS